VSLTWTINGTDKSSVIRTAPEFLWTLTECAFRGQVGASSFTLDDTAGTYTPAGQKAITVVESTASPTRMFTGYLAEREVSRGSMPPGQRQWLVTVEDLNVLLDDRVITGSDGNRAAETDAARILWLISDASTTGISTGHIPATNTVTMDAIDYRGKRPRDVLEDCAQKSGKNFFVYYHSSGPLLFYDLDTGTNLSSTSKISDVSTDVNGTTVFAATEPRLVLDPSRVYSKVRLRYKGGSASVTNATTATNYRTREVYKRYKRIKSASRATEQAQKWLDQAANEQTTVSCGFVCDAANVNDIRAGMRVQIKLTRLGISSFTYYRVTQRTVRPTSDVEYRVELTLADSIRPTKFQSDSDDSEEEMSNATEDDATVIIDSGGITVDGGTITVTNSDGVVIIDGASQMFQIVASLSIAVPRNTVRGDVKRTVWVNTGLSVDPVTFWSMKRAGNDGDWSQVLPLTVHNLSGQILEYHGGRARYNRRNGNDGTDVQALKGSTSPPLTGRSYRVRICRQTAI
jgi:hypothetical protein